jgi:rubrerythrin
MYTGFTETAVDEGFNEIVGVFRAIAVAEKQHEKMYLDLVANIEAGRVFKMEEPVRWRCGNCGYIHKGKEAPKECPACAHPREHFELRRELLSRPARLNSDVGVDPGKGSRRRHPEGDVGPQLFSS